MFAAYKRNAAKRKAARAANNEQFKAKIAAINSEAAEQSRLLAEARAANNANLRAKLDDNNAKLREALAK